MKKAILVLYDQEWILKELPTAISTKYATLTFRKVSFADAPMQETVEGTKISNQWMLEQVNTGIFDAVAAVMNGDRLNGRNGVHIKAVGQHGRFSIIQVEAHRGVYREWVKKKDGTWYLNSTKRKTRGAYRQVQYTFDHELGHALKYQGFQIDDLHSHVSKKQYEEWWAKQPV